MTTLQNQLDYKLVAMPAGDYSFSAYLRQVTESFDKSFYKKGEVLLRERNPAWGVYFVNTGKLKLYKLGSDGKEQIIKVARDGDFIGYSSVLHHTKYNVTAALLEDATVTFIPKADFMDLYASESAFAEHILQLLCQDVQQAEKRITDMAYRPVRGRLAEALLTLDTIYQHEDDELEDFINLSRQDLANLLGTAKETVIRLLSEFRQERLITTDGYRISILSPEGLRAITQMYERAL